MYKCVLPKKIRKKFNEMKWKIKRKNEENSVEQKMFERLDVNLFYPNLFANFFFYHLKMNNQSGEK